MILIYRQSGCSGQASSTNNVIHTSTTATNINISIMSEENKNKLRAAILIISDTASRDPSTDKAGDALIDTFAAEGGGRWDDAGPAIEIVPDDEQRIQRQIRAWTDGRDFFNLVVTTGGTGFAQKDNTPEVSLLFDIYLPRVRIECNGRR